MSLQQRVPPSRWTDELAALAALGAPLVLSNLAGTALATADVVIIGRLGPDALAASALGTNLYLACLLLGIGLVSATAPLLAKELGRGRQSLREVRRTVRQGLWSAAVVSLPFGLVLWHGEAALRLVGEEPALAAAAGRYLRALQWAIFPTLAAAVLRAFVSALERPGPALAIALAAIPVNVGLALALIDGRLGLPALGLPGAGVATAATSWLACLASVAVVVADRRFRRYGLFGRLWRLDPARFRQFWALGLPIAGTLLLEMSLFGAAALAMGRLGAATLAAHAIAVQIASLTFMVPLGIGQAATVRVGLALGAGDPDGVTRAGRAALLLVVGLMMAIALGLVAAPRPIIGLFVDPTGPGNAAVTDLAVAFLLIAALFQVADGVQAVGSGMLRGLQDARVPMVIAALGYWVIGAPLGLGLAFAAGWGGRGLWIGLATALAVVALLMTWRWSARDRLGLVPRRPGA